MRFNKNEIKKLEKLINEKSRIGMELTLGDRILTCVDIEKDSYGSRYIFDNGSGWTKSNILSNIINAETKEVNWYLN